MYVKTKLAAQKLGVNPTTVQRWVKTYRIPCPKNKHGHLLFSEKELEMLRKIQEQLKNGLSKEDIAIILEKEGATKTKEKQSGLTMEEYEKRLDALIEKTNRLEKKLSEKADDVVSVRLFQHRSEIDELAQTLSAVEEKMAGIEKQLRELTGTKEHSFAKKESKRSWFQNLFSPSSSH